MGRTKIELARERMPPRLAHNSRLFVDLCENIHIHYRELRIIFSLSEFFEFADILQMSQSDVRNYLASNSEYKEQAYPTTIMIAGGKNRQKALLQNSPKPNESVYDNFDFVIELMEETETDEIQVHWRDYRLAIPRSHLRIVAHAFGEAVRELDKFESSNPYVQSPNADRSVEELEAARSELAGFRTAVQGITRVNLSDIATRWDINPSMKPFRPEPETIQFLSDAYKQQLPLPPVLLSTEGCGRMQVVDGNHRVHAAREAGITHVDAVVLPMTFNDTELLRRAESSLKNFDAQTGYTFQTSRFLQDYLAFKLNVYYTNHYRNLFSRRTRIKTWLRVQGKREKRRLVKIYRRLVPRRS